jgi:hypothetical protein
MNTSRETHALFESRVADATMAASSHNTQPWRFEIGEDRIRILPDFTRRCSVVDPDDRRAILAVPSAALSARSRSTTCSNSWISLRLV